MSLQEIDPKQLDLIQLRFTRLSENRFARMLDSFNMAQVDCIKLLPFLFHVNQPMLPGYVDKTTPCGVPNYTPSALEKKIAKSISRSFVFQPRAYLRFEISALYLMGSTGTLAQSPKSDLDLWICLADDIEDEFKQKLLTKMQLISHWFESKGVELNCYLVFQHQFSLQSNKQIGRDNCGNTQNLLLLDEFYRTAIWLCGRKPLWWMVAPTENYGLYGKRLLQEKHLEAGDWLDFGEISEIPAAEYFSAALWQLYKAIESPYKSSLKLLVLEIYARYFPQSGLLSTKYKQLVYQGDQSVDQLDPYVLILSYAENFLQDQPQRLEFLRRAFYLKAGKKIELNKDSPHNWRYQQIKLLVQRWQWKQTRLDYLNDRMNWRVNAVMKERIDLVRELNHSYHFLSNFGRVQGVLDRSSQKELVALGRRLYATFERRADKIDCVNTGIVKDISEASVTINNNEQGWSIYLGTISQKDLAIHQSVYHSASFFAVLAWCVCNQLVTRNTHLHIYSLSQFYNREFAEKLIRDLIALSTSIAPELGGKAFNDLAKIIEMGIYLNTDRDPLKSEKDLGVYSVSNQSDGFCWGEFQLNLFVQFDVFWVNSWGEYCCKNYSGDQSWVDFFSEHREFLVENEQKITFFSGKMTNPEENQQRIFQVLRMWNKLMVDSRRKHKSTRFMMSIGKKYLRLDFVNKQIQAKIFHQASTLLNSLSETLSDKMYFHLDENIALPKAIFKIISKVTPLNYQCYLVKYAKNGIQVFVCEPQGSLFFQQHYSGSVDQLMNHYQQFFDSIIRRLRQLNNQWWEVEFWTCDSINQLDDIRFKRLKPSLENLAQHYLTIQAVATYDSQRIVCFDLHTVEASYLYADFGELVYQKLAKYIIEQRKSQANYPIFITDIDLSGVRSNKGVLESLEYKRQVEQKIALSMKRLLM